MASLAARIATLVTEQQNVKHAIEKEVEERRRDHDELTKVIGSVSNLKEKIDTLDGEKKERDKESRSRNWQAWFAIATALLGIVLTLLKIKGAV